MKLTPSQRRVLMKVAGGLAPGQTAWILGRGTCEALRKRGLVEGYVPITRYYNPSIIITDAGRAALALQEEVGT